MVLWEKIPGRKAKGDDAAHSQDRRDHPCRTFASNEKPLPSCDESDFSTSRTELVEDQLPKRRSRSSRFISNRMRGSGSVSNQRPREFTAGVGKPPDSVAEARASEGTLALGCFDCVGSWRSGTRYPPL